LSVTPKNQLNLRISEEELEILEKYCEQEQRAKSEVVRELIRSLKRKIKGGREPLVGFSTLR
jgi:Ribbon-helix-helix protein, copG family